MFHELAGRTNRRLFEDSGVRLLSAENYRKRGEEAGLPSHPHQQSGLYSAAESTRIKAKLLPLFGNEPIVQVEDVSSAETSATKANAETPNAIPLAPRKDVVLRLGIFGSIHPEWSPDAMFSELKTLGRRIQLSHIGRTDLGNPSGRISPNVSVRRLSSPDWANDRSMSFPVLILCRFRSCDRSAGFDRKK
jgi:hypothetical protein